MEYTELRKKGVYLGRAGENGKRTVWLDVTAWNEQAGGGSGVLLYTSPKGQVWPLGTKTETDETTGTVKLSAPITLAETAAAGIGHIEAQWMSGGEKVKSQTFNTLVLESAYTGETVPDKAPHWVQELIEELNAAGMLLEELGEVASEARSAYEDIRGTSALIEQALNTAEQTVAQAQEYAEAAEGHAANADNYKTAAAASATAAAASAEQAMDATPDGYAAFVASMAGAYSAASGYAVGDYVLKDGQLYKCNTAIDEEGETWTAAHWTAVTAAGQLSQLSEEIYDSVISKNMIGPEPGVLYPVNLKTGDVITVSTSDGQTGDFIRLNLYDENMTYLAYYNITHSTTKTYRTVTLERDVYYIEWKPATDATTVTGIPKVERGSSQTAFVPWFYDFNSMKDEVGKLNGRMTDSQYLEVEHGSLLSGAPASSNTYVRLKGYARVEAGDVLKISPSGFNVKNCTLYFYTGENELSYSGYESLYTTSNGAEKVYRFETSGYFRFRCTKNDSETVTDADIAAFNGFFELTHHFAAAELKPDESVMDLDYESIKSSMTGLVNFAVQTDTHMSLYRNYSTVGATHSPSDFDVFKCVLRSMNKLGVDGVFNLGDIVRGFEFDQDYETRNSLDEIIKTYVNTVKPKKCFVVGNHDDGDLFYYNSTYNDKQSESNVLYPNEQFNRITKYANSNSYLKNYYYCDISGIRVIVLYQKDTDYATSVPQTETFKIGADQINWLENTALDTNLPVLVLTHSALVTELYSHSGTGFSEVLTVLQNFVSGGGTLIACLSGHSHVQQDAVVDGINHIGFDNGYRFFELVSIDLSGRTITCKAINNSDLQDRTFDY